MCKAFKESVAQAFNYSNNKMYNNYRLKCIAPQLLLNVFTGNIRRSIIGIIIYKIFQISCDNCTIMGSCRFLRDSHSDFVTQNSEDSTRLIHVILSNQARSRVPIPLL